MVWRLVDAKMGFLTWFLASVLNLNSSDKGSIYFDNDHRFSIWKLLYSCPSFVSNTLRFLSGISHSAALLCSVNLHFCLFWPRRKCESLDQATFKVPSRPFSPRSSQKCEVAEQFPNVWHSYLEWLLSLCLQGNRMSVLLQWTQGLITSRAAWKTVQWVRYGTFDLFLHICISSTLFIVSKYTERGNISNDLQFLSIFISLFVRLYHHFAFFDRPTSLRMHLQWQSIPHKAMSTHISYLSAEAELTIQTVLYC